MTLRCRLFGHNWGEFRYRDATSCNRLRECVRCGIQDSEFLVHQFGNWDVQGETRTRQCTRCKSREKQVRTMCPDCNATGETICSGCGGSGLYSPDGSYSNCCGCSDCDGTGKHSCHCGDGYVWRDEAKQRH